MTAIALTAAQISLVDPDEAEVYSVIVTEAVTAGQAGYQLSTGKFGIADANASGKQQFRGIFLRAAGADGVTDLLVHGRCYGFTVSSLDADAPLYLSDTAGSLDDSVGTMTVNCARVTALTNVGTLTKVVMVDADWNRIWS
jgi:hypothetical protein